MNHTFYTFLIICLVGTTALHAQKQVSLKKIDSMVSCAPPQYSDSQFIYHGITNAQTNKMGTFTKKYDIGFHNPGCIVMNREHSKAHNIKIAESLTSAIGSKDWISELPLKIDGVN